MMARKGNKAQKKYTPKPPKGGFNSQPTNVLKPPLGGLGVYFFCALFPLRAIISLFLRFCEPFLC